MTKFKIFTMIMVLSVTAIYGQVKKTSLEIKNEKLNEELIKKNQIINIQTDSINKLEQDMVYYKQTLHLLNSKISGENKEVAFKINSVVGDSSTGKISIEGILINNGILRSIQAEKAEAFDPKGNGISTYEIKVGSAVRIDKLLKDIPTKFTINFKKIAIGTPMIRALIVDFYSDVNYQNDKLHVVFKNLDVTWK